MAIPQLNLHVLSLLVISSIWFIEPTCPKATAQAPQQPDVLFLSIDDLNDWIGPLSGHPQAITPNLDRLAKRAVVFTDAHCQAPICNPSRISLLTGRLPSTTGVYYLSPLIRQCATTKHAVTLPQYFSKHGYLTLGVGKTFHTEGPKEFDVYGGKFGGMGPRQKTNLNCDHVHPLWDWGPLPIADQVMPDHQVTDWAIEQLTQSPKQPRFMAVGFFRPHVPLYVPEKWFEPFPLESIELPLVPEDDLRDISRFAQDLTWGAVAPRHTWFQEQPEQWKKAVQAYLASIAFVDHQVGRLLDTLEQSERGSNTIIVMWSDHGFHLGTKERWGKRSLWTDSTRVPLMIATPSMKQGTRCQAPVGLIDLFPTLTDLCQLPPKQDLEGHSLVPLLNQPKLTWPHAVLTQFGPNNDAVRTSDWTLIQYEDASVELYDRKSDPHEFQNLAGQEVYRPNIAELREHFPQTRAALAPGSAHLDARPGSPVDIDGPPDFDRMWGRRRSNDPPKDP
ncbi:MAG: sulfatase [Mariniblastus sp.]|nr:sulfatase [Mariniblastus sp.]